MSGPQHRRLLCRVFECAPDSQLGQFVAFSGGHGRIEACGRFSLLHRIGEMLSTRLNLSDLLDEDYDPSRHPTWRAPIRQRYTCIAPTGSDINDHTVVDDILAHADAAEVVTASAFTPTFSSSRYEARIWISELPWPILPTRARSPMCCAK